MGTDIHPYLEVKVQGEWKYLPIELCSDRNYELFAILSGVRGQGPSCNVTLHVLPHDVSKEVSALWDNGSWGHSLTTITYSALTNAVFEANGSVKAGVSYMQTWWNIANSLKRLGFEDVRVIAWYDS